MNKSLIALAVLGAFAGAASAQSSVTLYGRLDTAVVYTSPTTGDSVVSLAGHDPIGGSRWGMRGSEDLGNGLTAIFVLESGFAEDTGTSGQGGRLFGRNAYVGLASKSLGTLRLGRIENINREFQKLVGDISAEGELIASDTIGSGANAQTLFNVFGTREDNAISYTSPSFGGLKVQVNVSASEDAAGAQRQQGALLTYSAGPFTAGLAYETRADRVARAAAAGVTAITAIDGSFDETFSLGASYNFGVATLLAAYQKTDDLGGTSGRERDAYNVGVMVPFGNFQFRGQYTRSETDVAALNGQTEAEKYGLSLRYQMSKRTQLYTFYTHRKAEGANGAEIEISDEDQLGFGIGHNF